MVEPAKGESWPGVVIGVFIIPRNPCKKSLFKTLPTRVDTYTHPCYARPTNEETAKTSLIDFEPRSFPPILSPAHRIELASGSNLAKSKQADRRETLNKKLPLPPSVRIRTSGLAEQVVRRRVVVLSKLLAAG